MTIRPRFCPNCGTELATNDPNYCTSCGGEVFRTEDSTIQAYGQARGGIAAPPSLYRSPSTRSTWTVILLVGLTLAVLASFISTIAEIDLLLRLADGEFVEDDELIASDNRQRLIAIITLVGYLGLIIAFCFWVHRVAKNLKALNVTDQRFSPGWAVGWWFVPIMNLFRPYQVMSEIWKGSDPLVTAEDSLSWRNAPAGVLLGWWWGIWLTSNFINTGVSRAFLSDDISVDGLITADYFSLAGDALTVVAAVLLFMLVRAITSNQAAKYFGLKPYAGAP